ncbi:MAG: O-antigen ligase family protein [Caldithrix sp.]|nr:MAG: O-antigen ligase family protein [Caldithrix sp.]
MELSTIRRVLLFLLIFLAPFHTGWIFRFHNGIFFIDVPLILLIFLGFIDNRKFKFYWKIPAMGFIVWVLLTGMLAIRYDVVFSEITRFIRGYLVFLYVVNSTRDKKDFNTLVIALFASFGFQSILGFIQWRSGYIGLSFLGEDSFWFRAGGLFSHPNVFADFLIFNLPLVLRLFVFYKHKKRSHNIFFCALFLSGLGALFATYSRGAWLSFVGATVLMLLYSLFKYKFFPKVVSGVAFLVLLGTIFAVHYVPTVVSQFEAKNRQKAAAVRVPLNKVAFSIFADNAIWGVGMGQYTFHTHKYAHEHVTEEHDYYQLLQVVHNSFLLILSETGIVGFLFYGGIFFLIFKHGIRVMKNKNPYVSNMGLGILTGFLAFFIAMLAGPDLRDHQIQMVFWILAGFLVVLSKVKSNYGRPKDGLTSNYKLKKMNGLASRASI